MRKVFGRYASTHLETVVNKAYLVTLSDEFQGTAQKRQQMLNLFAKRNAQHNIYPPFTVLPECTLSDGIKMVPEVRYEVSGEKDLTISSIHFKLHFGNGLNSSSLSISKNKEDRFIADLNGTPISKAGCWITKDQPKIAKKINDFIAKILNDTSSVSELKELEFYATNHACMPRGEQKISQDQKAEMIKLGWEHFKDTESSIRNPLPMSGYLFRKEKAEENQSLAHVNTVHLLLLTKKNTSIYNISNYYDN